LDDYSALIIGGTLDMKEEEPKLLANVIAPLHEELRALPVEFNKYKSRKSEKKQPSPRENGKKEPEKRRDNGREAPVPPPRALVIRIPHDADPDFKTRLLAALSYFGGSFPVRLFDEQKGICMEEDIPSVDWNEETAGLLMAAFGDENFGYL